jgi:hypothetical protein
MMKKRIVLIFVMLFSVSFVSAGFFDGVLGGTGNAVLECVDSDLGDPFVLGKTQVGNAVYVDECLEDKLIEYICTTKGLDSEVISCESGCENGVCVLLEQVLPSCYDGVKNQGETDVDCGGANCISCNTTPLGEVCKETDKGLDMMNRGVVETSFSRYQDSCSDEFTLLEYYCEDGSVQKILVDCDEGCKDGKCSSAAVSTPVVVLPNHGVGTISSIDYLKRIFKSLSNIEENLGYSSSAYEGDDVDKSLQSIYTRLSRVEKELVGGEEVKEKCGVRALEINENCEGEGTIYVVCNDGTEDKMAGDTCDNGEIWKLWAEKVCDNACAEVPEVPEEDDKCGLDIINYDEKCEDGYRYMKFACTSGYSNSLGDETSCKDKDTWKEYAKLECKENCEGPQKVCGDGVCHPGESIIKCPVDCLGGQGLAVCGDGKCSDAETAKNCREDCGTQVGGIRARIKSWLQSI